MLRSIRSTAFIGTLLFTGVAAAQPAAPASDDSLMQSGKPAAPIPVPAPAPVAVPAPPPPADTEAEVASQPQQKKAKVIDSAGLSSQSLSQSGGTESSESTTSEKDWGFKFKGYFRGPMRLGIDNSGSLMPGQLQFHAPPVTPDGNYTRWMFTGIAPGPWAELLFQYGNQRVMMTTSIASYNITSGGWRELQDQLGIDRAFLTLKFPEALGDRGGMAWDVGVFSNFYGAFGKYDGGEYQTYMFGRTRIAGATATADIEINDDMKLLVEGGFGAKVDQQYQRYAGAAATYDYPSWQPFPGNKTQQGTNMLAHLHAGLVINGVWTVTGHYINSFVRDARWNVGTTGGTGTSGTPDTAVAPTGTSAVPSSASIQVGGVDVRLNGGWMGDGYIGYSHVKAHNALAVADSIEVLHSQGGWQLAQNYFADGNGSVDTIAGQYTFSLAAFAMRPRPFWGQAADLSVTLFGMYNRVSGTDAGGADGVTIPAGSANMSKLKYGGDLIYSPYPMMAVGFRMDLVNPNMSDSNESFQVFTPKLIFRSEFVTHEMIVLQGSFYNYGSSYSNPNKVEAIMPWPYGKYGTLDIAALSPHGSPQPDKYVISLAASMWW
jgi:hypothetical protein